MASDTLAQALILGIIEGLTEFIPVSSTGHLLLAGHFMGFDAEGKTFEIVIQLGAVLAIIALYARRLMGVAVAAPHDLAARRFMGAVLLAFVPAVVVGVLAHDIIKTVLFESPRLIAVMLILGGLVLLGIERIAPVPVHHDAMRVPLGRALAIGCCQVLAMVPGVSRSGATIVGGLMLGLSRKAAAEFSFFLSIPTMLGAASYDLYKNRAVLDTGALWEIIIGFVAAAITGFLVVRWILGYLPRHGFALFGWWRIIVGVVVLVTLGTGPILT